MPSMLNEYGHLEKRPEPLGCTDCATVFHVKHCFVLLKNDSWVGPPVLILLVRGRREVIDGRARLAEHTSRRLKCIVPEQIAGSYIAAIGALIHNGHHDRAARMAEVHAPELLRMAQSAIARIFDLSHQRITAFKRASLAPSERHKLPRRALSVVLRVRSIRERMLEGESITINDLDDALGSFLED